MKLEKFSGGSKGDTLACAAMVQFFFNFIQHFKKFGKIVCWSPLPRRVGTPPAGNPGSAPEVNLNFTNIIYTTLPDLTE